MTDVEHYHDWQLAKIEAKYADGAWELARLGGGLAEPIGTMGLFYCCGCLEWKTSDIPSDLPGFGAARPKEALRA